MKQRILFTMAMAISLTALPAAVIPTSIASAASASSATDKKVATIRAEVARINAGLSKLKKTEIPVENVSAEGAMATYYRNGTKIRKIEAELLGETFQAKIDLYYVDDQLIFAFDRHSTYKAGLGSPIDKTINYRLYFSNGTSIRALAGTKRLSADDASTEVEAITELSTELKAAIT